MFKEELRDGIKRRWLMGEEVKNDLEIISLYSWGNEGFINCRR